MTDKHRLLIIGARGFLGTYSAEAALTTGAFDVIRADRTSSGQPGTVALDLADGASVVNAFRETRPDSVLLLAAIPDIDRCEQLPDEAFAINARGAEHVANACSRANARLLFTSTGAVFDGTKHGYSEEDAVTPVSVYGRTKAWAENAVRTLTPSAVIVRFALVLGFARRPGTNAILDTLAAKWKSGEPVSFTSLEQRNPIDAAALSRIMLNLLADRHATGTYHIGSLDSISRYELGKRLAKRLGVTLDLVKENNTPVVGRAPRGADHFLLTDKIRSAYNLDLGSSDQVIERCFS